MSAKRSRARATGRRAVLVVSPNAGNATGAEQLAARLSRVNVRTRLLARDLDHTQPQGTVWRDQGYDLVIAAARREGSILRGI